MVKNNKNLFVLLLTVICLLTFTLYFSTLSGQIAKASTEVVVLEQKAACRISTVEDGGIETSGLKFAAKVNKSEYENLLKTYDDVSAGIIIVPADFVDAAGGYTFNKLSAYKGLEGKTYHKITEDFKDGGDVYEFTNSIVNIKPSNYNRDFTAIAFIKVLESDSALIDTLSGYTLYDGAYYLYSNTHTACVYDIAYAAFNDRVTEEMEGYFEIKEGEGVYGKLLGEQYDIIKNYLDGVAVISTEDGINVANNSDWYTSPFGIAGGDDNYSVYNATSLTVDGNRCKTLAYSGDVNISVEQAQGATVDSNGVVTLAAADTTSWHWNPNTMKSAANNNYISYEGNYGVGTYIEFVYTGNNMPSVMFFADEINGNFTFGGGNGLLILNGWKSSSNNLLTDRQIIYGPNRMNCPMVWGSQTTLGQATATNLFSQKSADASTEYRYVVGTKVNENNEIVVVGRLYNNKEFISVNMTDGLLQSFETTVKQEYDFSYAESGKGNGDQKYNPARILTADLFSGTNIVAYGLVKADGSDTTFKCLGPKAGSLDINIQSSGLTKNADGSITLKAVSLPTSTDPQAKYAYNRNNNSYIGFQGDYGVGTYIDIIFKGNNMPNIMLLADDINGNMSCFGGDSGLFIATGYVFSDAKKDLSTTRVYGPNRMNSYAAWEDNNIVAGVLTQQGLINAAANPETADREYKLTVGTKKGNQTANGYEVVLVMKIYDNTTGVLLNSYEKTITQKYDFSYTKEGDANYTGQKHNPARTLTTDLFSGTNIILYQAFKGEGIDTTFKYSMPYTINE